MFLEPKLCRGILLARYAPLANSPEDLVQQGLRLCDVIEEGLRELREGESLVIENDAPLREFLDGIPADVTAKFTGHGGR